VHLWQRGAIKGGATEVWGSSCPKLPTLDPPVFNNIVRYDNHNFLISDVKFCSSRIGTLRLCDELLCGRHA